MDLTHVWLPYSQMQTLPKPIEVVGAEGVRIALKDGRTLVDGTSSWWAACHGYNHPYIKAAVKDQLERMPHIMLGGIVHAPILELTKQLCKILPGDLNHVFLSESGSVSVEIAMKMATQFFTNQGDRDKFLFLSFRCGYHGDTFAAMSVGDPEDGNSRSFAGIVPAQMIVDLPRNRSELADLEAFVAKNSTQLAAVILEPLVQAAGGMKFHSPMILAGIAEIASRHGVLLILDEIATGFGRTGTLFACEQAGVVPDIITLSKALTGGTSPLAATVATDRVYEAFLSESEGDALMHGPTFSGHPLGCVAAIASLSLFEMEPRLEQVLRIEAQLSDGLELCRSIKGVHDVRCKGAIGVVQLDRMPDLAGLRHRFIQEGVWVRPFGDVVYLMPPLIISEIDLGILISAIHRVLSRSSDLL